MLNQGIMILAVVTNSIDAIVIAFATASVGGVFSSTAPDMGVQVRMSFDYQHSHAYFFSEIIGHSG